MTSMAISRKVAVALMAGTLAVLPAACGDDDGDSATDTTAATENTEPENTEPEPTEPESEGETVEVTLADYEFRGLPAEVAAGTKLTVVNDSSMELHELVAIRLPDDEERSVQDLLALPEDQLGDLMNVEPTMVLLAEPESDEMIPAVGDGTFTEPGRYLIACFIPTGANPQEYMNAAQGSDGPPEVEGGPPHFVQGMQAELTVT